MSTIYAAKLSPQGQITIPKHVRSQLKVHKGQYIRYKVQDGEMVITSELPVEKFFGKVNVLNGMDPEEFHKEYQAGFGKYSANK